MPESVIRFEFVEDLSPTKFVMNSNFFNFRDIVCKLTMTLDRETGLVNLESTSPHLLLLESASPIFNETLNGGSVQGVITPFGVVASRSKFYMWIWKIQYSASPIPSV